MDRWDNRIGQWRRESGLVELRNFPGISWAGVSRDGKWERGVTSHEDQNENALAVGETRGDRWCIKRKGQQNFQKLEEVCCGQQVWVNGLGSSPEAWEEWVGCWQLKAPTIPLASGHSLPTKWSSAGCSLGTRETAKAFLMFLRRDAKKCVCSFWGHRPRWELSRSSRIPGNSLDLKL